MPAPRKAENAGDASSKDAGQAARLSDALAEAGWVSADRALAQAMTELEEAASATNQVSRAEALSLLRQSLARAARARGFARLGGEEGSIEPYDPRRHDFVTAPKRKPKEVMIVARGVARGEDVLVKARVKPSWRQTPA